MTTNISVHWSSYHRSLHVIMYFNRDVMHVDIKRCQRAFAEALDEAFTQQGIKLETIDLHHEYVRPRPGLADYELDGWAKRLRGNISAAQLAEFGKKFLEQLNKTREYSALYQRKLKRPN